MCRQYLAAGWQVFATHRSEPDRLALRDLGAQTLRLDVADPDDLAALGWQLDGEPIDLVVCNAGVYGPRSSHIASPPSPADFDLVMQTNVLGTMRLVPVVAPLLYERSGTLAFISSRMGSIAATNAGFGSLYRVSKAALNMVTRLAASEYGPRNVRVLTLHPGWVRTDMGGPNASVAVQTSVTGLRSVIANAEQFPGGGFYDYRGERLEW